jgi:hypothetical protein
MPARNDTGAAAVEFALVSLIFFPILFGIIQYGLFFSDSIGARQGVRDGARSAVVMTFPSCGGATTDVARLACNTRSQIGAISGPAFVKVVTPDGWVKGKALVVCGMVQASGALGLVPMPNGGIITTKTQMSIENTTTEPSGTFPYADTPPAGADWSWCS